MFKGVLERELRCSEVRDLGEDRDSATARGWRLRVRELRPKRVGGECEVRDENDRPYSQDTENSTRIIVRIHFAEIYSFQRMRGNCFEEEAWVTQN